MFTKQCSSCREDKPLNEFARHPLTADKLTAICKSCGGVDLTDYLTFCIKIPSWQFELSAAVIVNQDIGAMKYYMGRLKEANALYPIALREMIKLISAALDEIENDTRQD